MKTTDVDFEFPNSHLPHFWVASNRTMVDIGAALNIDSRSYLRPVGGEHIFWYEKIRLSFDSKISFWNAFCAKLETIICHFRLFM